MFKDFLLVGAGGFLGSSLRYAMAVACVRFYPNLMFPLATFIVNISGCFLIGFLGGLAAFKQIFAENGRLFVFTGILGGFTTFSAFGLETFHFIRNDQWPLAFLNIFLQLAVGLTAVAVGHSLASRIF